MSIEELLEMQKELDNEIVSNYMNRTGIDEVEQKDFLTERLLALHCEVSELANETRSFKYWSTKGPGSKEKILAEYADCMHFMASIGNTLDFTAEEIEQAYLNKHEENYKRQEENY